MDDLGFGPSVHVVIEQDALFKEDIHLVVILIVLASTLLLVDVEIEHLLEVVCWNLVGLDRFR